METTENEKPNPEQAPEREAQAPEAVPTEAAEAPVPVSPWRRWALPVVSLAVFSLAFWALYGKLRDEVWAYYTDEAGMRVEVQEGKARRVLWQDPKQNLFSEKRLPDAPAALDPVNKQTGKMEAAFSPDGTKMVLTRWSGDLEMDRDRRQQIQSGDRQADLYMSKWDGRSWTRPAPIDGVNTESNERGAAFSRDGRYLYFSSNRAGGQGGYDLYVARWNGRQWTAVEPAGEAVNTSADETGPALSRDHDRLYFSRTAGDKEDIYFSELTVAKAPTPTPEPKAAEPDKKAKPKKKQRSKKLEDIEFLITPPERPLIDTAPMPAFAEARPVSELNSAAADVNAALTGRGDHVFLASDRERSNKAGFGLYLSRVVDGQVKTPERIDVYIKEGNTTAPVVRMQGFDMLFSADHEAKEAATQADAFKLYRSTTREVIGYTDLSRWEMFKQLLADKFWWILAAIAALIGLIYILEKWQEITSLYHRCLAGSVAVHLLLLLLMAIWNLAQMIETGAEPQAPEIAINMDALAQEELALESTPDTVEVAESTSAVVSKLQSDFKVPVSQPKENVKTTPIVASTAKVSLVQDVRPSKVNDAQDAVEPQDQPQLETPELAALPEALLPSPDKQKLEEAEFAETVKPVDVTKDEFTPDTQVVQKVETKKTDVDLAKMAAQQKPVDAEAVDKSSAAAAATKDTGGELILAKAGLEAIGQLPELDGAGNEASLLTGQKGSDARDNPALPGKLSVPKNQNLDGKALTKHVQKIRGKPSMEVIEQLGGSDATEKAIGAGLEWLTQVQEEDGRWDGVRHGSKKKGVDTGVTGLALLCYYGWGIKHNVEGKYATPARKGVDWLIGQQKEDGDLRGEGDMYCHGIATIALCEAYGLTKDERLGEAAKKAIDFLLKAQSPKVGGWRYKPRQGADTSVTGWAYMAMHSAQMADIKIDEDRFEMVRRWLDNVSSGPNKGLYGYTGGDVRPAMVATGMFCRQLDLVRPTDPRMQESAEYLKNSPIAKHKDYYYIYYGTLCLYQHQGPIWEKWNTEMKEYLLAMQKVKGETKGSWDPSGGHAASGGRMVSTTMSILSLEVYYRLLPMYGFRGEED